MQALVYGLIFGLTLAFAPAAPAEVPGEHAGDACRTLLGKMKDMEAMMAQHHAMMGNKWTVADDGIYTLLAGRLEKRDENLKVVKAVALASLVGASAGAGHSMMPMADLAVTSEAVYVSWQGTLLKLDHNLSLLSSVRLMPR